MLNNIVKKIEKIKTFIFAYYDHTIYKKSTVEIFLQYHDIGNFKILQLLLYSRDIFKIQKEFLQTMSKTTLLLQKHEEIFGVKLT